MTKKWNLQIKMKYTGRLYPEKNLPYTMNDNVHATNPCGEGKFFRMHKLRYQEPEYVCHPANNQCIRLIHLANFHLRSTTSV